MVSFIVLAMIFAGMCRPIVLVKLMALMGLVAYCADDVFVGTHRPTTLAVVLSGLIMLALVFTGTCVLLMALMEPADQPPWQWSLLGPAGLLCWRRFLLGPTDPPCWQWCLLGSMGPLHW